MAAIDSLLRVMVLRDADALTMATGQVPSLRRAGQAEPLAMPAMDAGLVSMFLDEIVPPEQRAGLGAAGAQVTYLTGDGVSFGILIEKTSAGHRMIARRSGSAKPTAAAAKPAVLAAPAPSLPAPSAPPAPVLALVPAASRHAHAHAHVHADADAHAPTGGAAIESLIALAAHRNASDVLLSSGQTARLRVDGEVVDAGLDEPVHADAVLGLLDDAGRAALAADGSADFALDTASGRVRANVFRHHLGVGAALRLLRTQVPSPRDLALPEDIVEAVRHRNGLVLIAGPAGAGKSTTLVALVEHLNRTRGGHIITLEDPIEYQYAPRRGLIHQREVGVHAASFADGLRAALREAPDVIVVGELRDHETIAIALTAAETGHLVLGTLHAPGGAVAVDRIIDVFPEQQQRQVRLQLASVLRVVLTQHLVPTRGGGRVPAVERVVNTPAVANLIRKAELHMLASHVQAGRDAGMIALERSLARLVREGTVAPATARACAQDLDLFEHAMRAAPGDRVP